MLAPPPRLTRLQHQPAADAGNQPRHELVGRETQQGRAHQRGGLVDGPEQPALRIVEPARDRVAGGLAHQTIAVPTRLVTMPVPAPAAMPTPTAPISCMALKRSTEPTRAAPTANAAASWPPVPPTMSCTVSSGSPKVVSVVASATSGPARTAATARDASATLPSAPVRAVAAGARHLPRPRPHRSAPGRSPPSSTVETRSRASAQASRAALPVADPVPEPVKHRSRRP